MKMKIIEELEIESKTARIALLIRHADRNRIPDGSFGNEIQLNTRGKQNAFNFGQKLTEYPINKIFTSPIMRCEQTAKHLLKGYKQNVEVEQTKFLGAPGPYIYDEKLVGEYFLKYGVEKLYKTYISEKEIPGLRAREGSNILYEFMKENTKNNGITIFITHDIIIAQFDFHHSGKIYSKENWIKFLGGCILRF